MLPNTRHFALILALVPGFLIASAVNAQTTKPTTMPTLHPALFLVGDSILNPGSGPGGRGPVGWGKEITPRFDPAKIYVYNEGHGGRSSRSYIDEGWWAQVLSQMQAGDFVIMHFGNNDSANSKNYPDRISLKGNGDDTKEIDSPSGKKETIHSYGWYLRQYVRDARVKGVTVIICSPPPRNKWVDGKIVRGMDGYAQWAADAAKMSGAPFIDLNTLAADRYDALGQDTGAKCFVDTQHTTKAGAQINAESVIEGLKQIKGISLTDALLPAVSEKAALPALYVVGDSTAANDTRNPGVIQGWGTPFLTYFDSSKIKAVNAARGGRSSRTYITEGHLDELVAKLNPGDTVLVQWGHNDPYPLNDTNGRGSLFGIGEETQDIVRVTTNKPETLHTFGWYMRKYVHDIRAKGANPIILTLTIRDRWIDGKIERDPSQSPKPTVDRPTDPTPYSIWSAEVAKAENVPLLDVHNMIADRYDKEGPDIVSTYFNNPGDPTHRNPAGAAVDAEITLACLKTFEGPAFDAYLNDQGKSVAPADAKYIFPNTATTTH